MNPTRREMLKLAASLPGLAATMNRHDALAALNAPEGLAIQPGDFLEERDDRGAAFSPTAFAAKAATGTIENTMMDANLNHAADALNAYKRARLTLIQAVPELKDAPFGHPFVAMDEAVYDIWSTAWLEGVRAGAAFEHLRRELLGAQQGARPATGSAWSTIAASGSATTTRRRKPASAHAATAPGWSRQ
jgi:hypothetical protein